MATKKNADGTTKRARFARQGERFTVWRKVSTSTAANLADLPEMAPIRVKLDDVIVEVDKILVDQSAFQASKQMSTQRPHHPARQQVVPFRGACTVHAPFLCLPLAFRVLHDPLSVPSVLSANLLDGPSVLPDASSVVEDR